jgi:hypothetical protein
MDRRNWIAISLIGVAVVVLATILMTVFVDREAAPSNVQNPDPVPSTTPGAPATQTR